MKTKINVGITAAFLALLIISCSASAMSKPVTLADQGSFMEGGSVVNMEGADSAALGATLRGDHAYVFYQKPVGAHKYPLVFLHGGGQSGKTWESTPDGRDGFQNIFLEKNYSTYIVDQPRRGRAGQGVQDAEIKFSTQDKFWYEQFRIGMWPQPYEGIQFSEDAAVLDQFLRQITPNIGDFDMEVISDAMSAVFAKSGAGILVTHSAGGGPGWLTALKSSNVKAVISFEPWNGFIFPQQDLPAELETSSSFGSLKPVPVSDEDFMKLTKIPILVYYGDNIPAQATAEGHKDSWRARLQMARLWVDTINKYGGDASLVHLPEQGVYGNTHFIMSDLNNRQIADHMEAWIKKKGLL